MRRVLSVFAVGCCALMAAQGEIAVYGFPGSKGERFVGWTEPVQLAYVMGVLEGMGLSAAHTEKGRQFFTRCVGNRSGNLKSNPEHWHRPLAVLVEEAIQNACGPRP